MGWQEDVAGLVADCVDTFSDDREVTIRGMVEGDLDEVSQTVESEDYSLSLKMIRSAVTQGSSSGYGTEDTVYRGKVSDLDDYLMPSPQLAAGMYVEDAREGSTVRRRVVRVAIEGDGAGFALFCVTDRSPSE